MVAGPFSGKILPDGPFILLRMVRGHRQSYTRIILDNKNALSRKGSKCTEESDITSIHVRMNV